MRATRRSAEIGNQLFGPRWALATHPSRPSRSRRTCDHPSNHPTSSASTIHKTARALSRRTSVSADCTPTVSGVGAATARRACDISPLARALSASFRARATPNDFATTLGLAALEHVALAVGGARPDVVIGCSKARRARARPDSTGYSSPTPRHRSGPCQKPTTRRSSAPRPARAIDARTRRTRLSRVARDER